jgi:dTDP-4-amino-4,6-dideoxygalactose transaminase
MPELPLTVPLLDEKEIYAARGVLLSGWLTQGPKVKTFEQQFAAYTGAKFACAVSSCTTALHLALMAVGVKPGDVVLTVSHSFIATANAIRHCQAEPVFVDIDADTFNMSPTALEKSLAEDFVEKKGRLWFKAIDRFAVGESPLCGRTHPLGKLAAILVVHQVGLPADMKAIMAIAKHFNLPVVEDAACAIGSEININKKWEKIGKPLSDIACFSFHPRKLLTTGDGGMLVTNNAEYDRMFRLWRHHGMTLSDRERHAAEEIVFEEYEVTGYNYRLTDIQAAIGTEQLKRIPHIIERRRALAADYSKRLAKLNHVKAPIEPSYAKTNWQSYIVRLDPHIDQKQAMQTLKQQGIASRRGIMCAHLEKPYASGWPIGSLPESEKAQRESIILPLYSQMQSHDVERVVAALASIK